MNKQGLHRQGDTVLAPASAPAVTGEAVARGRIVLALGESTGHAHVLTGAVAEFLIDGQRMIFVESPAEYRHGTTEKIGHSTQTIMPGWYVTPQQVEYTPAAIRRVMD